MEATTVKHEKTGRTMQRLRTRAGTKAECEDSRQNTELVTAKQSSRITAAQNGASNGMEGAKPFQSPKTLPLTSGLSTPQSLSPTPPADGSLANFGVVMPGIYRSAWPTAEGYEFMRGLGLKTIVTLVAKEEPDTGYSAFIKANGIKQVVFDIEGTKKSSVPNEVMRAILQVVLDKANHPLLIHCNRGRHRTGCIVGVLRKLHGWSLPTVLAEYNSFADPKPRETDIGYLTTIEPTNLFASPAHSVTPYRMKKGLNQLLMFAIFVAAIWVFTMYRIAIDMPVNRHS